MSIGARFTWTVDLLDIQPDDRVLEIGSGHGIAIELVATKLKTGKITAIDRSEAMLVAASARNANAIVAGLAEILATSLQDADFGRRTFTKVFAINVNAFWMTPEAALAAVRKLLAKDGTLTLVYEPPTEDRGREIAGRLTEALNRNGFVEVRTLSEPLGAKIGLVVTATLAER